jgi:hypothetical protein
MKWLLWFDLPLLLGFAAAIGLYGWAWDARHVIGMAMAEPLRHSTSTGTLSRSGAPWCRSFGRGGDPFPDKLVRTPVVARCAVWEQRRG